MGVAAFLGKEVLWWGTRPLEDAEEWVDVVQYYLDWCLPVLFYKGYDDGDGGGHAVFWEIL